MALASPGYPAYRNILRALGVEVVEIQVDAGSNFQPTPKHLDAVAPPLHGLIVASPANPTGTMLHRGELFALIEACAERGVRLVSDEIYHGITYGPPATTALERDDDVIVVNSFSKYYAMTGWRLGWMVLPDQLLRPVECLAQNLFISPPTLSQLAAVEALACRSELDGHVARYGENRALLVELLPQAGFGRLAQAEGAFYLYADVSEMSNDSTALCREILQRHRRRDDPRRGFRSAPRPSLRPLLLCRQQRPHGRGGEATDRLAKTLSRRPRSDPTASAHQPLPPAATRSARLSAIAAADMDHLGARRRLDLGRVLLVLLVLRLRRLAAVAAAFAVARQRLRLRRSPCSGSPSSPAASSPGEGSTECCSPGSLP